MSDPDLTVVIPSRNGADILREFLPAILAETRRARGELILVDDCSADSTAELITREYPSVRLLRREGEPAFCRAVNLGMAKADSGRLLLLNNDTVPEEGSFTALLEELSNAPEETAAAVPSIPRPDGTDDGDFRWAFVRGLAVTGEGIAGQPYPSGACALWKRDVWEELGGLDTRYAPIYWEDTDLGVRMRRAGYGMIRCPRITVAHHHASTMGAGGSSRRLRERNRFIFMDSNCSSRRERLATALWLPLHSLKARLSGNRAFTEGYRDYREWKELRGGTSARR
ncbi:MAG: glycosyltransferase family 2 protein [Candidatus Aegiribacteria sp.]